MEKQPGNDQTYPDYKSEKTDDINQRQFADTFFPEFAEIRGDTDSEKGHYEKDSAEDIGCSHRGFGAADKARRRDSD